MKKQKIQCPHCKSKKTVKRGYFKTKSKGKQQRYYCKSCNKKFIEQTAFYRMRNAPQKITLCLDLFFRGVSTRKVQEHLQAFYPHNSDHSTILRWIRKYSILISKFTDTLKVNAGHELQSDEMEYHRLGKQNWFVDVMDTKTRYIVSSEYIQSRTIESMTKILKKARYSTGDQISTVTTDGLKGYPRVLRKTFGLKSHWNHKGRITHNVVIASERGFNHKIERLHNSVRQLTQKFRGFHGSLESARAIMKGYEIYYNFIRKHQAFNKCPYELAIPELKEKLNSPNRWLELINLGAKSN